MSRRYVTTHRLAELGRRLSPRDQAIVSTLDALRVATTTQLGRLHFADLTDLSRARQSTKALRRLEGLGVVARLERQVGGHRSGSAAAVWSLDLAGQRLTSACGPAGGNTPRRPWTPSLSFLAHRLAISESYVEVCEAAERGTANLLEFAAEPYCWRRFTTVVGPGWVKPDAHVRVMADGFERGVFLEVDRATESLPTIARKLRIYAQYWESGREQARRGYFPFVVFAAPHRDRAAALTALCERQGDAAKLFRVIQDGELATVLFNGAAT
jgi:hypothetical protein